MKIRSMQIDSQYNIPVFELVKVSFKAIFTYICFFKFNRIGYGLQALNVKLRTRRSKHLKI